jgi:hypothetical protein
MRDPTMAAHLVGKLLVHLRADLARLPLRAGVFDLTVCHYVLEHVTELAACRDRENVLWLICALVSAIDASSAQGSSWIYRVTALCERGVRRLGRAGNGETQAGQPFSIPEWLPTKTNNRPSLKARLPG